MELVGSPYGPLPKRLVESSTIESIASSSISSSDAYKILLFFVILVLSLTFRAWLIAKLIYLFFTFICLGLLSHKTQRIFNITYWLLFSKKSYILGTLLSCIKALFFNWQNVFSGKIFEFTRAIWSLILNKTHAKSEWLLAIYFLWITTQSVHQRRCRK